MTLMHAVYFTRSFFDKEVTPTVIVSVAVPLPLALIGKLTDIAPGEQLLDWEMLLYPNHYFSTERQLPMQVPRR